MSEGAGTVWQACCAGCEGGRNGLGHGMGNGRLLAGCVLVGLLSVTAGSARLNAGQPLKVMTFNIRDDDGIPSASDPDKWVYTSGPDRRDRAVQVIVDQSPDIVALQEAEPHQAADLAATNALRDYAFYLVGREDGVAAGQRDGILYRTNRFSRTGQGVFWLSQTPDVPGSKYPGAADIRIVVWAKLLDRHVGRLCLVMSTHWDYASAAARTHSANLVRQRVLLLASNMPVIVAGDFNMDPDEASYDVMTGQVPAGLELIDSYRQVFPVEQTDERTIHFFSGNTIGQRVDYIFTTPAFTATNAAIVRTTYGGRYPSDHYPVTAELVIEPDRPVITAFGYEAGEAALAWTSVSGMFYRLQYSEGLATWTSLPASVTATSATATATSASAPARKQLFYRVVHD